MKKKLLIILLILFLSFIIMGTSTAVTPKNSQIENFKVDKGSILKPDLKPTSIVTTYKKGSYYINLGVKNQGKKTAPIFISDVYVDGKKIGYVKYPALKPNKTGIGTIKVPKKVLKTSKTIVIGPNGERYLIQNVVDPRNKVKESNENNNKKTVKLTLASLVLKLNSAKIAPNTLALPKKKDQSKTQIFKIELEIENLGLNPIVSIESYNGNIFGRKQVRKILSPIKTFIWLGENPIIYGEKRVITYDVNGVFFYSTAAGPSMLMFTIIGFDKFSNKVGDGKIYQNGFRFT